MPLIKKLAVVQFNLAKIDSISILFTEKEKDMSVRAKCFKEK
jgi:hypothetical protein